MFLKKRVEPSIWICDLNARCGCDIGFDWLNHIESSIDHYPPFVECPPTYRMPYRTYITPSEKNFVYETGLPGFCKKDVNVEVSENILKISAKNKERGEYSVEIELPEDTNLETISSTLKDGILNIFVEKSEKPEIQSRQIKITDGGETKNTG